MCIVRCGDPNGGGLKKQNKTDKTIPLEWWRRAQLVCFILQVNVLPISHPTTTTITRVQYPQRGRSKGREPSWRRVSWAV